MAQQIYYLQSCDEWKSTDSMRLLFIGTSSRKLMMVISHEIEVGNMEYKPTSLVTKFDEEQDIYVNVEVKNSSRKQAELFRKDWKTESRRDINNELLYGYFDYTYNNECM